MSIVKDLEIKINNDKAKLNESVYIYQNDRGIELRLRLNLNVVRNSYRSMSRSAIFETDYIFAAATIMKPNGEIIGRKRSVVTDDTIVFIIDKEFTDELNEIGTYKMQFHLYDDSDNRITIPPVEFEVKELLGSCSDEELGDGYGVVDASNTDVYPPYEDGKQIEIFSNGKYIKTIWKKGDLITTSKLNKIEEAIETLDNRFHIGGEPIYKTPEIWVDLNNIVGEEMVEGVSYEDHTSKILKTITDRIEVLEKEIELLKNNNN